MTADAWAALLAIVLPPAGDWLGTMLTRNAGCRYLAQFGAPRDAAEFAERVPLTDYDALVPWIEEAAAGAPDVMFSGRAVGIEQTGGSSGGGKYLPFSPAGLADVATAVVPWLQTVVRRHAIRGRAYFSISPAARRPARYGAFEVGLPDGAFLGPAAAAVLGAVTAVPFDVARLTSVNDWRRDTLQHLHAATDLELISVWSPTFLLNLLGDMDATRLWPRLKLVSCWASGPAAPAARELARRLPQARLQPKGLLSTEAVITVPDEDDLPRLSAVGLFEFLQGGRMYRAHDLRRGERYEVVATTANGLYRYRTGDIVSCADPGSNGRPVLHFEGRHLTSDLVGEKLTEPFVSSCLLDVPGFRLLVPNTAGDGYLLVADHALPEHVARVEQRLCANPQYEYARRIGQLHGLRLRTDPAAAQIYEETLLARGVRLGDIKPVALRIERDWAARFGDRT